MSNIITVEAKSVASLSSQIQAMDHETRAQIVATEGGVVWATLNLSPMTDTQRSLFPCFTVGVTGDTRKRGQSGAMFSKSNSAPVVVVIERARRMAKLG